MMISESGVLTKLRHYNECPTWHICGPTASSDLNVINLVDFTISSIGTKSAPDLLATGMTDSKLFLKTASLITSERIASEHVIFFFGNLLVTYGNLLSHQLLTQPYRRRLSLLVTLRSI